MNPAEIELSLADRWIISRLQRVTADVATAIDGYRFDLAAQALYEFTWNEYCDWYLELSKPVLNSPASSPAHKRGTRRTLVRVLETLLRLAHPVIPFITEEIWQRVRTLAGRSGATIMTQPFPLADPALVDDQAVADIEWLMAFILGVRKIRSSMNIAPGKPLPVLLQGAGQQDRTRLDANRDFLVKLARLESIDILADGEAPESATALVGDMKVLIPMSGLIDREAELARLDREIGKLEKLLSGSEAKLSNQGYLDKAPAEVVARERQKVSEVRGSLAQLQDQRQKIEAM